MLAITVHASGSTGNCYTVTDGQTTIMLDCGLPFRRIQRLVGFKQPDAVLVTHEHQDHAKAAADFLKRGVDVYMTRGTAGALGLDGHRLHPIWDGMSFDVGGIRTSAFPTNHDAAEPCGFLLYDDDDKVLYITDTYYIRYRFEGLTKIMVEVNHSYEILRERVDAGELDRERAERLKHSHFALENVLDFFRVNDLSKVTEIWLIHLSRNNADPELFRQRVAEVTGKAVFVA